MSTLSQKQSQQGAALLVCLVLLLGMTVVGIASMKETVTQQKVANAITEDDTAFQAAEMALRQGEQLIFNYTQTEGAKLSVGSVTYGGQTIVVMDETDGGQEHSTGADLNDNWWKDQDSKNWDLGAQVTGYPKMNGNAKQRLPSYIIEILAVGGSTKGSVAMGDSDKNVNYRVTARGFGVNDSYYVVLQTTYSVQL